MEADADTPEASSLPLDAIHCAGQLNINLLAKNSSTIPFVVHLLTIILSVDAFIEVLKPETLLRNERHFTSARYEQHFSDLLNFHILREVKSEQVRHTSTYFAVPKKGHVARSIFNGKRLSAACQTPPPCNIPDITSMIKKLEEINTLGGNEGLSIVCGDLRHFFHQIPIHRQIQPYFGVMLGKGRRRPCRSFLWRTLPMGWSFSPSIAQATAWAWLAHSLPHEKVFIDISGMESSPMFVHIREDDKVVGVAVIYYDNYLIASYRPRIVEEMSTRVQRNARIFNLTIKEHDMFSRKDLISAFNKSKDSTNAVKRLRFLGVEFALSSKRDREGTKHYLRWRIEDNVSPMPLNPALPYSPRQIGHVVGKILYARLVSLRPLGSQDTTRTTLEILRRSSKTAWKKSWTQRCIQLSEEEIAALETEWLFAGSGQWHEAKVPTPAEEFCIVATDASDQGWAAVLMNLNGEILHNTGFKAWPEERDESSTCPARRDHIFLKEMYAAVEGTRWAAGHCSAKAFKLVVDNTAVAGALKRGYSTNLRGTEILAEQRHEIEVITIVSEDNVADSPSRNEPLNNQRRLATEKCVKDFDEGRRNGNPKRHPNMHSGLRHVEGEDDDVVLDQIPAECMKNMCISTTRTRPRCSPSKTGLRRV